MFDSVQLHRVAEHMTWFLFKITIHLMSAEFCPLAVGDPDKSPVPRRTIQSVTLKLANFYSVVGHVPVPLSINAGQHGGGGQFLGAK